jgi:hypothetical protein
MAKNFQTNVMPPGGVLQDGAGNGYLLTVNADGSINVTGVSLASAAIADGVTGTTKATVMQFHNADNQALAAGNGLCVGGIGQVLNSATGNLDRARAAGFDQMPATGIPADLSFTAMLFQVGTSTAVAAPGSVTITLTGATGLKGKNHGVPWNIQVGTELVYDYGGANQENILVTAINASTPSITATFANTHGASVVVVGSCYNQARDASGECDGASGAGTTVAAEYEFNGSGPGGANNYDRARNIMAKGLTVATISSGTGAQSTAVVLSGGPAVSGPGSLQPGMQVLLYIAATGYATGVAASNFEVAYVGLNYVPGATTVPLVAGTLAAPGLVNAATYTAMAWDSFVATGPQSNGFLPFGVGVESDALYNPKDGKMYLPRTVASNPGAYLISTDGDKSTYRAALSNQALYSTAAAVILEIQGSATKTIRVKKITMYSFSTAAVFFAELQLGRATSVGGGTPNAVTPQKMDSNDAGATAVLNNYTGASTSGSGYAQFGSKLLPCVTGAATVAVQSVVWDFCQNQDKAFVLRGTSQWLEIYNVTTGLTSAKYGFEVEWEEDNS